MFISLFNSAEEFRVYEIEGLKKVDTDKMVKKQVKKSAPPRFTSMPIDQDWTNVWPTASTFKWSVVPFPVRQGYVKVIFFFFPFIMEPI